MLQQAFKSYIAQDTLLASGLFSTPTQQPQTAADALQ